jgi:cellobiose-specific phosphotransferase system component IIC
VLQPWSVCHSVCLQWCSVVLTELCLPSAAAAATAAGGAAAAAAVVQVLWFVGGHVQAVSCAAVCAAVPTSSWTGTRAAAATSRYMCSQGLYR